MSMRSRVIVGSLFAAIGIVWMAQGLGLLRGSGFMDGDPLWAVIGGVMLVGGVILAISGWRLRPPPA